MKILLIMEEYAREPWYVCLKKYLHVCKSKKVTKKASYCSQDILFRSTILLFLATIVARVISNEHPHGIQIPLLHDISSMEISPIATYVCPSVSLLQYLCAHILPIFPVCHDSVEKIC